MPTRKEDGSLVFKVTFYGPESAGKRTMMQFLYQKEGQKSLQLPSFITTRVANVYFQVATVAGQKRNKHQRQVALKGTDAILFVWDSQVDMWEENIWYLRELLQPYGEKLIPTTSMDIPEVPLVLLANKRDMNNIVDIYNIRKVLEKAQLFNTLIYEAIGISGINVKRAFVYTARQAVLNHYKKIGEKGEPKREIEKQIQFDLTEIDKKLAKFKTSDVIKVDFVIYNQEKFEIREGQLDLSGKNIEDLTQIKNLEKVHNLENINLSNNEIEEIKGIEHLKNLKSLDFSYNKINDIIGIEDLNRLVSLDLSNNSITKIRGLDNLIDLTSLNLSSNQIYEINNLESHVNLEMLDMSDNKIKEISGFEDLNKLQILKISNNFISQDLLEELGGLNESGRAIEIENYIKYCQTESYKAEIDKIVEQKIHIRNAFKKIEDLLNKNKVSQAQDEIEICRQIISENNLDEMLGDLRRLENLGTDTLKTIIISNIWGDFELQLHRILNYLEGEYKIKVTYEELKSFMEKYADGYSLSIDPYYDPKNWDIVVPWEMIVSSINNYIKDVPSHQYHSWPIDNLGIELGFPLNYKGLDDKLFTKLKTTLINTIEECKIRGYFIRDIKIDRSYLGVLAQTDLGQKFEIFNKRTEDFLQEYTNSIPEIFKQLTNLNRTLSNGFLELINIHRDHVLPTLIEVHNVAVGGEGWEDYKKKSKIWKTIINSIKIKLKLQKIFIFVFKCDNCGEEYQFIYFQETKLFKYLRILLKLAPWIKEILDSPNTILKPPKILNNHKDTEDFIKISPGMNLMPEEITFLFKSLIGISEDAKNLDQTFHIEIKDGNVLHYCINCRRKEKLKSRFKIRRKS